VHLFQIHPVKIKTLQVATIQEQFNQVAQLLETSKQTAIARHLQLIGRLLEAAELVVRASRLERFASKIELSRRAEQKLAQAYNDAKGIRNQTVLRRLSAIRKIANRAIKNNTVFSLSIWDLIREFPLADIIRLHPAYDFRLEHPQDPIPILEQREYSEQIQEDKVFRFHTSESKKIFHYLVGQFINDMKNQVKEELVGYRSLPQIVNDCNISTVQVYGKYQKEKVSLELRKAGWPSNRNPPGQALHELLVNSLVTAQVFQNERGRKGSPIRIRVAIEKIPIRLYIQQQLSSS
ncbi:MAG: hypothetical protein ACTSW4_07620, partial [Candidatus Ranarchaeia archaeon]